ncbi:MAG TPA: DUF2846 domain-containing protein [Stellaceae bacterium]|nr:DUF2846 domain-containing protein [Stellaceae bacterium]
MIVAPPRLFHSARALLAGALLLLAGCVSAVPPGEALTGRLPPPPPGTARLVFYRSLDYYGTQAMPAVYLNGAPAGITQNGAVLYRDVTPGRYDLSVSPTLPYPDQFKTVVVGAGDVDYVQIDTLPYLACREQNTQRCYGDTFILSVVDPAIGARSTYGLRLING